MEFEKFFERVFKEAEKEGLKLTDYEKEILKKSFEKEVKNIISVKGNNNGIIVQNNGSGEIKISFEDNFGKQLKSREVYYENSLSKYILFKKPAFMFGIIGFLLLVFILYLLLQGYFNKELFFYANKISIWHIYFAFTLTFPFVLWKIKRDYVLNELKAYKSYLLKNFSTDKRVMESIQKLTLLEKKVKVFGIF